MSFLSEQELKKLYYDENLSQKEIAKKFGVCKSKVGYWFKKYGLIKKIHAQVDNSIIGERFGRLIVIKFAGIGYNNSSVWTCQCDCGKIKNINRASLVNNLTKSCGCFRKDQIWKGFGELSGVYWYSHVVKGAEIRNLEFSITIEDAWYLFLKQNRKCALSGVDIVILSNYTDNCKAHTASLDRKDSSKGYTKDNIQWVHSDLNMMKRNHSDKKFIQWCKLVAEYNK